GVHPTNVRQERPHRRTWARNHHLCHAGTGSRGYGRHSVHAPDSVLPPGPTGAASARSAQMFEKSLQRAFGAEGVPAIGDDELGEGRAVRLPDRPEPGGRRPGRLDREGVVVRGGLAHESARAACPPPVTTSAGRVAPYASPTGPSRERAARVASSGKMWSCEPASITSGRGAIRAAMSATSNSGSTPGTMLQGQCRIEHRLASKVQK